MAPSFSQQSLGYGSSETLIPTGAPPSTDSIPIRPPRKQVSRACDWCRARRIKCDSNQPCRACRQRGANCTSRGGNEARTLPQALKEIDRLSNRVKELEAKLKQYEDISHDGETTSSPSSLGSPGIVTFGSTSESNTLSTASSPKAQWEGIFTATARSEQKSYYGPASLYFYMSRIGTYLGKSLQQTLASEAMQPRGVSKTCAYIGDDEHASSNANTNHPGLSSYPSMNRMHEECFLTLFWEGYHCTLPIIHEGEFRQHYESLWDTQGPYRKHSALVDIVIALCIQHGFTLMTRDPASEQNASRKDDPTVAGRSYYKRCQFLLMAELESPSITTLQCHIYSIVYLCCASFQNMAHVNLAQAVRTAQILGLHLEPPLDIPVGQRELRKRVWWVLYTIETKTCLKLGRPSAIHPSQVTVTQCSDSIEAASLNEAALGFYSPDVTWLTYSVQCQKLVRATADIYDSLYEKGGRIMVDRKCSSPYQDLKALETCAKLLASRICVLEAWKKQVPEGMMSKRHGGGEPLSTASTPLDFDTTAPMWLQRQRVYLELIYHAMASNLYRPFILFCHGLGSYVPVSERHAAAAVRHAIAHTCIMHQAVMETDVMGGWQEYFLWQWNVTITTVGFVLAYPVHPCTTSARKALDKAIAVFDVFAANFAVAKSAATIARDLTAKADFIASRLRNDITTGAGNLEETVKPAPSGEDGVVLTAASGVEHDDLAWLDPTRQDEESYCNDFMDWASTIDSWNSFESFSNAGISVDMLTGING